MMCAIWDRACVSKGDQWKLAQCYHKNCLNIRLFFSKTKWKWQLLLPLYSIYPSKFFLHEQYLLKK